jgi:hypothetical protein
MVEVDFRTRLSSARFVEQCIDFLNVNGRKSLRCTYVYDDVTSSTMSITDSSGTPFSTVSPPGIDILFRQLRGELIDAGCHPANQFVFSQTGHDEFRFDYPD